MRIKHAWNAIHEMQSQLTLWQNKRNKRNVPLKIRFYLKLLSGMNGEQSESFKMRVRYAFNDILEMQFQSTIWLIKITIKPFHE